MKNFLKKPSVLAFMLFVSVPLVPLIYSTFFERQREEDFVFIFLIGAILLFPFYFIKKHRLYLSIVYPFLLIPSLLDLGHIHLFQGRISQSIFFVIFDTNLNESSEFLADYLSPTLFIVLFIYLSFSIFLFLKVFKAHKIEFTTRWTSFLLIWIIFPIGAKSLSEKGNIDKTVEAYRRSSHLWTMIDSYQGYNRQIKKYQEYANGISRVKQVKKVKEYKGDETHILVIGESTARGRMSLYGYHRDTTPLLRKMRDDLIVFDDVFCSDPPGTLANVQKIATFGNSENYKIGKIQPHIIDVMKRAGYKTYWLSNQQVVGKHDTMTTVIAKQADQSYFLNTTNARSYDEKLFPIFDKVLGDKGKKFIIIHLLGTHMKYEFRYPRDYEKFTTFDDLKKMPFHTKKKLNKMNYYDNAVLYNDFVVSELIKKTKNRSEYSSFIYLSDHGEIVYDNKNEKGHAHNTKSVLVYEIPFILWLSGKFKQENTLELEEMKSYTSRKYVSDDIIHTMLDMYGISTELYEEKRSLFSPYFTEKPRWNNL